MMQLDDQKSRLPPFSKYPTLFYLSVQGKFPFQGICSRLGETTQVVLPQLETVFLLRDNQLCVVKLKQKNKYDMLMDACQEGGWGAFNGE